MPFDRPTLSDLRTQAATDINAALPGVDALLRFSNLGIIADVLAALTNGHYGYLDWVAANSVPFTATGEFLEGWAGLKGIIRKPATRASGTATFTGTDGAVLPAGTVVNRTDGASYATVADVAVIGGRALASIQANENGAASNAGGGTALYLGTGVVGVTGTGTALGPLTGGADIETDAELRTRMLAAYAAAPQGGSIDDYGVWALAVPGVTRVWVTPSGMGPGSVVLYFMMDGAQADRGGFPQGTDGVSAYETRGAAAGGDQLAVADALYFQQPVTALVYAVAPTPNRISLTIAGIADVSAATKSAVADAVARALRVDAQPGGRTNISSIEAAIAAVAGSAGFVITKIVVDQGSVAPGAAGNITSNPGALPVLDGITYQ